MNLIKLKILRENYSEYIYILSVIIRMIQFKIVIGNGDGWCWVYLLLNTSEVAGLVIYSVIMDEEEHLNK